MIIPVIEQIIQSVESIQDALNDGICSDTCGYMSESRARLEHAKEILGKFKEDLEAGPYTKRPNPQPS